MTGFTFRTETWDRLIFDQVVQQNEYGLPPRLDGWIVDIGAHVGSFVWACCMRGARRVLCYEACRENFELARRNVRGLRGVEVHWAAVQRSDRPVETLFLLPHPGTDNTGGHRVATREGIPVPAISLDEILRRVPGRCILKIDCEGGEYRILRTSRLLKEKVHTIVGEYHTMGCPDEADIPGTGKALAQFLRSRGFRTRFARQNHLAGLFHAFLPGVSRSGWRAPVPKPPQHDYVLRFFGRNRWPDPVTFGLFCPGFGDVLRSVQYACWVQETFGTRVSLYTLWHGIPKIDYSVTPLSDKEALIREILPLLNTTARIELVRERPAKNYFSLCGVYPFWVPLVPTRTRWPGWGKGRFKRIAYQFDGASMAEAKNPPPGDTECLPSFAPGYEFVRLGKPLSVQTCLETAANCDLFVGVDSGMMQLCYAVGTPVFLIRYRQDEDVLTVWHGRNHAVHCADTDDFFHKARAFLGLG